MKLTKQQRIVIAVIIPIFTVLSVIGFTSIYERKKLARPFGFENFSAESLRESGFVVRYHTIRYDYKDIEKSWFIWLIALSIGGGLEFILFRKPSGE
jgi:hypothetical protein